MKEYQTPQKENSRPSDLVNHRSKESQSKKTTNVPKKNLNAAFKSLSVEFPPEISKEPADFSPISEVSVSDCNSKFAQGLEFALVPSLSASTEPLLFSDLTPSSTITVDKDEHHDLSPDHHRSKFGSVETDVAVSFLKRARHQISNSVDTDTQSKKLLDALITTVVDELSYAAPAKRDDCLIELVSMKTRVVFACLLFWILVVLMIFFLGPGSGQSYIGPLPT
ncbi:hypothetical protein Ddye_019493 [Dipteronia dyeriana]|uniref:Uncharacterized protein n=1 Tax=Dipteronia dyeriana TaxID=168575 RepID=A0AAD9WVP4_9ROSI|nr:hypothetical protein Ddye_019493 [Dipteronia dyeriana]